MLKRVMENINGMPPSPEKNNRSGEGKSLQRIIREIQLKNAIEKLTRTDIPE